MLEAMKTSRLITLFIGIIIITAIFIVVIITKKPKQEIQTDMSTKIETKGIFDSQINIGNQNKLLKIVNGKDLTPKEYLRTGAWWKSFELNTQTTCDSYVYPTPYLLKFNKNSFEIGLQEKTASANTIFAKKQPSIIFKTKEEIESCKIMQTNLLNASLQIKTKSGEVTLNITKGLGYFEIKSTNQILSIQNETEKEINETTKVLLGVDGNKFIIKAVDGSNTTNLQNFLIAYLPQNLDPENFAKFLPEKISSSQISLTIKDQNIEQIFSFSQKELFILLPHQQEYLDPTNAGEIIEYQKNTYNGDLKAIYTDNIKIRLPKTIPDPFFSSSIKQNLKNDLKKSLKADIQGFEQKISNDEGVYWKGKTLAKYTNLMIVADQLEEIEIRNKLGAALKNELDDWFQYDGDSDAKYFKYDKNLGSLLSIRPEYGHELLNDHHFHYGYYLYTLGYLAHFDKSLLEKYSDIANYMYRDVASLSKSDPAFPYLRYFDLYNGFSFASGLTYMLDGNNQESTSEAVNFWFGAYIWFSQKAEADSSYKEVSDFISAAYTLESTTINFYYFNANPKYNVFSPEFKHTLASIVFEGKRDYATWFSPDPNAIHGIQVIPVTIGSKYLKNPRFYRQNYESQLFESQSKEATWQDMTALYLAINNDFETEENIANIQTYDSGNSKTWTEYMKYYFSEPR